MALLLHARDPHDPGSYGYCPFLLVTGKPCPGCGGLRAINLLTRGDIVAAASSNLLVVLAVPVAALLWLRWVAAGLAGRELPALRFSNRVWAVGAAVVMMFWIARLASWGQWLAP